MRISKIDLDHYHEFNGLDHSHYGDDVLRALSNYRSVRLAFEKMQKYAFKGEHLERLDALQAAFDALIKARKAEVGLGTYLNKEQYDLIKPFHERGAKEDGQDG